MLTQQDISLRDVQRLLTCLALFPRTFDTLAYGSKSIVVGAALLKVLHPAVYAKLRDERLSLEEVSAALSLHQPRDPANRSPEHSDWCIWAIALVGTKAREYDQVPSLFFDRLIRSFGEYGEEFSWHDTRRRLADMFDSFTLPPS